MSRRGNEGALVAALVMVFIIAALWMLQRTAEEESAFPPMSTYSPTPDGALGLYELLQAQGFDVQRYGGDEYHYPPQSCLVLLDPPDMGLSVMMGGPLDSKALRLWLEAGGRLVYVSDPMRGTVTELLNEIEATSDGAYEYDASLLAVRGAQITPGSEMALWRIYQPGYRFALSDQRPPLFTSVAQVECALPTPAALSDAAVLLASQDPLAPLLLYRPVGKGALYWLTIPEIASNKWIATADNHRLLLVLLEQAAQGGAVHFEEHIHGYFRQQGNALTLLTRTRGGQLLLLFALAAVVVWIGAAISAARIQPAPVPPRRQAVEMVLAQSDMYQRAGKSGVIVRSLLDGLKRELMAARHLPHPPADAELHAWLDSLGGAAASDAAQVRASAYGLPPRQLQRQLWRTAQACDRLRELLRHRS